MKVLSLLVAAAGCGRSSPGHGALVAGQSGHAGVTSAAQSSSGGNQQITSAGHGGVDAGATSSGGAGGVQPSSVGGSSSNGGATIIDSGGTAGVIVGGTSSVGSGGATGGTVGSGGAGGVASVAGGTTGGTVWTGGTTGGGSGGVARGGNGGMAGTGSGGAAIGGGGSGTAGGGSGGTTRGGSGGTTRGGSGGTAGGGGMGGSSIAVPGDAGTGLSAYCSGDLNKLSYLGQDLSPPATNCPSWIAMDCCDGFGVNLHTLAQLGFDLDLDITVQVGNVPPGQYSIGSAMGSFRSVTVRKYGALSTTSPPVPMVGTLTTSGSFYGPAAWDVGLCLETSDASTRVYIPHVTMIPFSLQKRFQIFRLADQSITPTQAQAKGLDSLVLADFPLLDLGAIYYVEQSTGNIGTAYGSTIGAALRGPPSSVPLSGSKSR